MANRSRDTLLGVVLLLIAAIWSVLAINTIPGGFGDGDIGPRAFPLAFGLMLAALAAMLLVRNLAVRADETEREDANDRRGWISLGLVTVEIILYGALLKTVGFVLATPVLIIVVMVVNLGVRSPRKIAAMTVGITFGCWVVFQKLLGIYLATGSWTNLG